jgi:hypothetical protein
MLRGMARRVAILGFDGAQMLDVVGPFEVFSGANEALRAQAARGADRLGSRLRHRRIAPPRLRPRRRPLTP